MKRYEGLFILNNNLTSTGKEDGVTVAVDRISKDIEAAGGKIEATQKMDKRNFTRVADKKFSSGFYVNIVFQSPGSAIAPLQHKFGLNDDVFRVLFTLAPEPKAAPGLVGQIASCLALPLMANFNKVILAGNLTRDPELRYTPGGKAIAKFGLAVNRTWTNEAGEKKEDVLFVDIAAFARQAEVIAQYMKKGKPLLVEGRLKLDTWDDKQTGAKRSKHEVVLESFSFIDSKADGGGSPPNPLPPRPAAAPAGASTPANGAAAAPEESGPPPSDDDVPF